MKGVTFAFLGIVVWTYSAIVGIDLGTEYLKMVVVRKGKRVEIVENSIGNRKTPTKIALEGKRQFIFENDRIGKPEALFSYLVPLLGTEYNSTSYWNTLTAFRLNEKTWKNSERHSLKATIQYKKQFFDIEEILGMILLNVKHLAEKTAHEIVNDCVVAIPPDFSISQKVSLADSLKIAGLNPISFINENLAGAIMHSADESFNNETLVMYINMGAASFKVTIVKHYQEVNKAKIKNKMGIVGEAWDSSLGGRQFDFDLADIIAEKFNNLPKRKGKDDIRKSSKAMQKILAKAEALKEKLSAIKTIKVEIEHLIGDDSLSVYFNKNPVYRPILRKRNLKKG